MIPIASERDLKTGLNDNKIFKKTAVDLDHTFITPTRDETAAWFAKVGPMHDEWISDNEDRGMPAKAVYDEVKRLIKVYTK